MSLSYRWTSAVFLSTLSLRRATRAAMPVSVPPFRFLSTLSLRRATFQGPRFIRYRVDFYPRSPCGERQGKLLPAGILRRYFYPRSPCGERRRPHAAHRRGTGISIHALLAESDAARHYPASNAWDFYPRSPCGERPSSAPTLPSCRCYFYPRSPCGERPISARYVFSFMKFLSTLSLRRATAAIRQFPSHARFLSTLSLRRATVL